MTRTRRMTMMDKMTRTRRMTMMDRMTRTRMMTMMDNGEGHGDNNEKDAVCKFCVEGTS